MSLIQIYRGDDADIAYAAKTPAGAAYDLTGCTLTLEVAITGGAPQAITAKTFTITDAANGLATASIPASDTQTITGDYVYQVKILTAASKTKTLETGCLRVSNVPQ